MTTISEMLAIQRQAEMLREANRRRLWAEARRGRPSLKPKSDRPDSPFWGFGQGPMPVTHASARNRE